MTISETIQNRHDLVMVQIKNIQRLIDVGIETLDERDYALSLFNSIEEQLTKMLRDVKRFAMNKIPPISNINLINKKL